MASKNASPNQSAWSDLDPAEKQRIMSFLKQMREEPSAEPKQAKVKPFALKGYVRCELGRGDRDAFDAWAGEYSSDAAFSALVRLADSGYIVKLGPSDTGYQASLSAWQTHTSNDGYVLTAHAGDTQRAAALLLWKHTVVMQEDWSLWVADGESEVLR